MVSVNWISALAEKGFPPEDFAAQLVFDGLYHSPSKCNVVNKALAVQASTSLLHVQEKPELYCKSCYANMVFGGMQVRKWIERIKKFLGVEIILKSPPENFEELERNEAALRACLMRSDKFLDSWLERIREDYDAFRNRVIVDHRTVLEPQLIEDATELALKVLPDFEDPLFANVRLGLEKLRRDMEEDLADPTPRFLVHQNYLPQLGSVRSRAVNEFYSVGNHLMLVPRCIFALLRKEERFKALEVTEPPDPRVLETLKVLYDPTGSGPYRSVAEAFAASKLL